MAEQPIQVDVQIAGLDVPAGRLWTHRRGQSESATFSYREDYLQRADSYELDPGLPLQAGQHHTALGRPLFGSMSDCAPDGWGRRLVRRAEAQRARDAGAQQHGLTEVDFLLGARDDLRLGALRFRSHDSEHYLICRVVCQVGRVDRVRVAGGLGWSGGRGVGLGVGVASLMMRGLATPGPGFVLPACAV